MNKVNVFSLRAVLSVICGVLLSVSLAHAQRWDTPGKSLGKVSTQGDLIVMELDEGALGKTNLFDLAGRTLHFTPESGGYRVENVALEWDQDFGTELKSPQVKLNTLTFPFSGKSWDSILVADSGVITFGQPDATPAQRYTGFTGGLPISRFDQLADAAHRIINTVPAIAVFLKTRMSGPRYVKELPDRVVVTWDLTEPFGNIQDFTWVKTINRFQAVLKRDGSIGMSYQQLAAKDAIVGLYPVLNAGPERVLAKIKNRPDKSSTTGLRVQNMIVSAAGNVLLKVALETSSPAPETGPSPTYLIKFRGVRPAHSTQKAGDEVVWTLRRMGGRGGQRGGTARFVAFGSGVIQGVETNGNTISVVGTLPEELQGFDRATVQVDVQAPGTPGNPGATVNQVAAHEVKLAGIRNPAVDLSALKPQDGPLPLVYESFHYLRLTDPRDLACTVIKGLGDKFDLLAYYSDFRVDNQEAGTPSSGPVGGGVTGIGQDERGVENYCSKGRFQWGFVQPVYVGSNQMQEYPPADAPMGNTRDITFYQRQLGERTLDGKMFPYNYAISQIGHEMGHRWGAFVSAKVNGETIVLGPTHWARGLEAPVAFPYQRPSEASAMGGGVWQDNFDGTYTQLDDDYYVPATGWSSLDLYLMGLISPAEVPDFFILRNLIPAGKDANGHPIFKADRTKVTVQDVIAVHGPRLPDVAHSQRQFNTGMVVIVEHGQKPSPELIERANGIREQWIKYWDITTGHRSTMTATPN